MTLQLEDKKYYRAVDGTVTQVFKMKMPVWRLGVKFTFSGSTIPDAATCYTDNGICFASSESYAGFNLVSEFNPMLSCGVHFQDIATMVPIRDGSFLVPQEVHAYLVNLITRSARHIPL